MKFPTELLRKCWFLAGPTAAGKTALALSLSQELSAEIVSMDSMAVFRKLDIGTAKPTAEQQAIVPHHLIDLVEPNEEYSTARYLEDAIRVCDDIVSRGKVPLFAGGTGLYLRAVLRGVFDGPAADWDLRRKLTEQAEAEGDHWLHEQLKQVDPKTAARLHPNDSRRLIRALEIYAATGVPPSTLQQEHPLPPEERTQQIYWLHPPRDWLYSRIDQRVNEMMTQGLEQEIQSLRANSVIFGRTARQALGYREILDWIEGKIPTRSEAVTLIQTRTRQFAKRQHTWFRNLEECREVTWPVEKNPEFWVSWLETQEIRVGHNECDAV